MSLSKKGMKAKERNRIKRKLKRIKELKQQQKVRYFEKYPAINIIEPAESVDPIFVDTVRKIVATLKFNDRSKFSSKEEHFFRLVKTWGMKRALQIATGTYPFSPNDPIAINYFTLLGTVIVEELKKHLKIEKYIPYNDFEVACVDRVYTLEFDALLKRKSKYGTIYYSRRMPKVEINGEEYTVAYSRHAIDRICQRTVGRAFTYGGCGDAFAYIAYNKKFEHHSRLYNNGNEKHYLSFFADCLPGFVSSQIGSHILSKEIWRYYSHAYRVGYLPVGLWNGFACASTLLTPGMYGTPEDFLLKTADIGAADRAILMAANSHNLSLNDLVVNNGYHVLKWFHDNGVPQVIETGYQLTDRYA